MLYSDRIDISEGIYTANSNNHKECMVYQSWVQISKFCFNGCHDLMFCLNPSDIAIITVKGVISKSEAIHLLANFVLDEMNIKEINIQRNQYSKKSK